MCVCVGRGGGGGGWCISLKITFKGCVKKQSGLNENGKWRIDCQNGQTSVFWGSRAYFEDFLWGILKLFQSAAYRKPYLKCLEKLSYLGEHSEVSQARSLHACWTRMLYHDRLETIDNSQSTNSAKTLKVFNVYLPERFSWKNAGNSRFWTQTSRGRGIITTWHLLRSPRILCYIVDGSMLSILCVRLTLKVKVGIPESCKGGWYPLQKKLVELP